MADNAAIILFYLVPAVIGALVYEKNKIIGAVGGLVVAFIAITLFAVAMGV